jgi:hypothetical protein
MARMISRGVKNWPPSLPFPGYDVGILGHESEESQNWHLNLHICDRKRLNTGARRSGAKAEAQKLALGKWSIHKGLYHIVGHCGTFAIVKF